MSEITLTKENFEAEVVRADRPVLIDFWATWCGPCQMLSPIVSEIAEEYGNRLKVGKVNVDEQPSLAAEFRVASIPTLVVIKDGKIADMSVGYRQKNELEAMLNGVL